jgi:hypothetical protein
VDTRLQRWPTIAALLVAASACGSAGTDLNQVVNGDDGGSAAQGGNSAGFQDPFGGAPPYAGSQSGGDSSHNAGRSCMDRGCHGTGGQGGGDAPSFLIGGTVYQDYYGKVPAVGVEVRILDSAGHSAITTTGREGNFYIRSGSSNGVTFPAVVGARDATTTRPMITTLGTASMGSCAQATCHVAGGSPATGSYYPIHVP